MLIFIMYHEIGYQLHQFLQDTGLSAHIDITYFTYAC